MADINVKAGPEAPKPEAPKADKKAREGRSPAFPFVDLKTALERAEQFRAAEGKHLAPVSSAMKAWGLGEKTGSGRRTVAAMGHFGLFDEEGAADARKVKLSELALNILLDKREDSAERVELIQKSAMNPPIHKELWEKWGAELPSDATFETYLVRDRGFSSGGAQDLMFEYKSTLEFAGLDKSVKKSSDKDGKDPILNLVVNPKVGDLIQIEIGGALQLPKPARVRAIQDYEGQKWVFIEGSDTGVPLEQVRIEHSGQPFTPPPKLPETIASLKPGMKEEKNSLDEGEAILIWPENLSAESVKDLEYWLEGILKKAKRRAGIL